MDYYQKYKDHISSLNFDSPAKRTLKEPQKNSTYTTFVILLNASTGLNILLFPIGIVEAGYIIALIMTIPVVLLEHHCVHKLLIVKTKIENSNSSSHISYDDAIYISVSNGPAYLRKFAKLFKYILKVIIAVYSMCLGTSQMVLVCHMLSLLIPVHPHLETSVRLYALMMLVPVVLLNCIRNTLILNLLTHLSAFLSVATLTITLIQIISDRFTTTRYNKVGGVWSSAQYIGSTLLCYESIASVLVAQEDMLHPENLLNVKTSVLMYSNLIGQPFYFLIGTLAYWKYGVKIRPIVLNNLPRNKLTRTAKYLLCIYNITSYPTTFYPFFNLVWYQGFEQLNILNSSRYLLIYEYLFRVGTSILSVLFIIGVPKFFNVMSLLGTICIPNMVIVFPALLEYTYVAQTALNLSRILTQVKCLIIIFFGLLIQALNGPYLIFNNFLLINFEI